MLMLPIKQSINQSQYKRPSRRSSRLEIWLQDACQLLAIFALSKSSLPLCSLSFLAFCMHTRPLNLSCHYTATLHTVSVISFAPRMM